MLNAQDSLFEKLIDTTIYVDELSFSSEQEATIFNELYNNQAVDFFEIFYLSNPSTNINKLKESKKTIVDLIHKYESKKKKNQSKWVKLIYEDIHKSVFKKYEYKNYFDDVFSKGYYNCVSATAIYSIVFDELSIPYSINLYPNHVNLTALPSSGKIILETTDPVAGLFTLNQKNKQEYVNNLISHKIIESSDLAFYSYDDVFNEYFHTTEKIELKELVAIQYLNYGLYLIEEENYKEAIIQLEKSMALYPIIKTAEVLLMAYSKPSDELKNLKMDDLPYLIRSSRYKNDLNFDVDYMFNYAVISASQNFLMDQKDTLSFNDFTSYLIQNVKDTSIRRRIQFLSYGTLGEYFFKEKQYSKSYLYLDKAMNMEFDSLKRHLDDLYIAGFIYHIDDNIPIRKERLDKLEEFTLKNQNYNNNYYLLSYKAELICFLMIENFKQNFGKKGLNYKNELEKILDNHTINKNENVIAIAYAEAGAYYFRLGSKTKARELFNKGLEYVPGNYELNSRIQMLNY